jgi:hypothetical protein
MVVVCVTVIILGSVLTTAVARAWRIAARLSGARAFSAAAPHFRLPLRRSP